MIRRLLMRTLPFVLLIVCLFCSQTVLAAEVSGIVTEKKTGKPIVGAAVIVKDTTIGTITNKEGQWTLLDVSSDDVTLVFRMTGYKTIELEATGEVIHAELEISLFNMGEVVVTGTQTNYLYEEAPVKTEVVTKRQIEMIEESDLYGILQYSPGIRVENNCQNCGFTQMRMLGLEGGYSQVLINGDPIVSTMAGVYGLQQFPEQMIESLEIVKGGGSALYGANAIGGVVNVRLRRPMRTQSNVSFDYKMAGSHVRAETGFFSEVSDNSSALGIFIYGNARQQNGYDHNDDGFTDIGKLSGEMLGFNMNYRISNQRELTGYLHRIHEDRRGGDRLTMPSHQANISEAIETYRWGGNVKYSETFNRNLSFNAGYSFALADRNTYYGAGQDPNAYGRTENPVHYLSSLLNYNTGAHNFTVGVTHTMEMLLDKAVSYNRIIDDDYTDTGTFIQDTFSIGEKYTFVTGVRIDKHSLLDDPVISPRISAMAKITDAWKLRGNISTGFRPPQVFDEDLHITQVNGEGQVITNADDLTEEKSLSFSGTLDYMGFMGDVLFQTGITCFHTILDKQFQIVEADDSSTEYFDFLRKNGDGMRVSGIELQAGVKPATSIELQANFTIQSDELDSPEPDFGSTRIFRTPEQYGSIMAYYIPHHRISIFTGLNYTGSMKAPHYAGYILTDRLETTDAFLTIDIGLTYELSHSETNGSEMNLKAGVKNLTDTYQDDLDYGINRDAGYIYGPSTPRMIYAGIDFGL